jgi:UDP-glucose 4-epimerase
VYLVTGGGGFVGSHLARALVRRGEWVRVLENGAAGPLAASGARLAEVRAEVEWIAGDVRDPEAVRQACAGVEVVLHQAAIVSPARSVAEPELTHAVNVTGTLHVLQAARAAGVRRVVVASSAAVYGDSPVSPKAETLPTVPVSPYGVQKLAAEGYTRIWHSLYGLETVALRYFNIFGPGQDPASEYAAVIPRFIAAALAGEPPVVYGDGEQSRDFISIQNVVAANLLAATAPTAAGMVLNVGTGESVTLKTLLAEIGRALGRPVTPRFAPARPGDIRESRADISLLRATLGYTPAVSFAEGLAATIHAYQERTEQ